MKILAISGSLRLNSSSHVILDEIASAFPGEIALEVYGEMYTIPPFDGRDHDPAPVTAFKKKIQDADGVVICTPEYAFGVPGSLKNALDWTVGTGDLVNKPVALITASTGGEKAHESMQHILTALSARVTPETTLLISFIRAKVKDGKLADDETRTKVHGVARAMLREINKATG
jgi:chromate reductase, NAD(P)H dehydrogenase (quinone)